MAATILSPTDSAHPTDDVPFTVQDRRRKGFFTIDNEFIDCFGPVLGPGGIAVFNVLARFANRESECFPSQATIARLAGMSRMQASRELTKLSEMNLIAVEHRFAPNGSQRSNLYILLDLPPETKSDTPCNPPLYPPVTDSYTPHNGQLHLKNNTEVNNTQKGQNLLQQRHRRKQPKRATSTVPEDKKDVVVALTDLGISEEVAVRLTDRYSRERICEKIGYLEFLQAEYPEKVQNPRGWLRRAIEEDYGLPDGFLTQEERERQKLEETHKAQAEEKQARANEEARQAVQEQLRAQQEAERQALYAQYGTTPREVGLWRQVLADLKMQLPDAKFHAYMADTLLLAVTEEQAVVGLTNPLAKDWIENRLSKRIRDVLTMHLDGRKITVRFVDLD